MGARARKGAGWWASALIALVVPFLPACAGQDLPTPSAAASAHDPSRDPSARDPVARAVTEAVASDFATHVTDEQIRAVIVSVGGTTQFERYYASTTDTSRSVFSVTKSVMSTLVGQAISEGKLHLDDRLSRLLPDRAKEMNPQVAGVTLRQLLTMTAGFPDTSDGLADAELARSPDWVRHILTHQVAKPGSAFAYSDFGAHLLSPILEQATGQSVLDYARAHLFDPLGIATRPAAEPVALGSGVAAFEEAGFAWATDPQGVTLGFTHLKLRPRDMAKIGQLFLQQGRWEGAVVVPAAWVAEATVDQAGDPDTEYGYLWWPTEVDGVPAYFAAGLGGQLIEVVPQRQVVVVVSTHVDLRTNRSLVGPDDLARLATAIVRAVRPAS